MPPIAVQLSYRLGGADGVAVEARKWEWALHELGFSVRRVAGELDDEARDRRRRAPLPGHRPARRHRARARRAGRGARGRRPRDRREPLLAPDQPRRRGARGDACSTRTTAVSCSTTTTSRGNAPVSPRHPTCRRTDPNSLHVTINDHSRAQLANRGFDAITLRNAFDLDPRARRPRSDPRRVRLRAERRRAAPADSRDPAQEHPGGDRVRGRARAPRARSEPAPLDHRSGGGRLRRRVRAPRRRVGGAGHRRSGRQRPGRVRGRRPHPLPVDLGGLRQPRHRVDRPPPPDRRRQLSGARRAPRLRRAPPLHRRRRRGAGLAARARSRRARGATSNSCGPTARSPTCPDASTTRSRDAGWSTW